MPNLTSIGLTAGVPTTGTGTVSSLDNLIGTAGTASAQVQTVQGIASMTALKVDGSAVTQPVSLTSTTITGTVAATQSGTWTVQPGNTANTTPWLAKVSDGTNAAAIKAASTAPASTDAALVVAIHPLSLNTNVQSGAPVTTIAVVPTATANGATSSRVKAAASTNATSLKASAGQIYSIDVFNNATYSVYLKLYNKASAPTVGSDTPVWTIPVAASGGFSREMPRGKTFATGIAYAITKLEADSDTTVVVADDLTGSIDWI